MSTRTLILVACVASACGGNTRTPNPTSPSPSLQPTPSPQVSATITGTVIDEAGAPVSGATVTLSGASMAATPSSVVTDAAGHYGVTVQDSLGYGGHADKAGFETSWRDSYFEAGPYVLNFRLFRTLIMTDTDSVHLTVTTDGSVCGIDDDWWCRSVRVNASHTGTLTVDAIPDDLGLHPLVAIGPMGLCCSAPSSIAVASGDQVTVYLHLPWSEPGGRVMLRTSIR